MKDRTENDVPNHRTKEKRKDQSNSTKSQMESDEVMEEGNLLSLSTHLAP